MSLLLPCFTWLQFYAFFFSLSAFLLLRTVSLLKLCVRFCTHMCAVMFSAVCPGVSSAHLHKLSMLLLEDSLLSYQWTCRCYSKTSYLLIFSLRWMRLGSLVLVPALSFALSASLPSPAFLSHLHWLEETGIHPPGALLSKSSWTLSLFRKSPCSCSSLLLLTLQLSMCMDGPNWIYPSRRGLASALYHG